MHSQVTRFVISHMMTYIHIWGQIGQWRGIWGILDRFMDTHWQSNSATLAVTLALLCSLRSCAVSVTVPFAVSFDARPNLFIASPRLQTDVCGFLKILSTF